MSLIAALPLDVLRKSFGLLDLPDLCSSSAVAVVPRQVARPLFFELLKREFPHAAAEEKRACGGVAGTSVDDRERALELAARRRVTHERRIRALADAIDVAGEAVHEVPPPLPLVDLDDLSIFLRFRHDDRTAWEGTIDGPCIWRNGSLRFEINLTPETVDYPELWALARGPRAYPSVNNVMQAHLAAYGAQHNALFDYLHITALLLRKSDSKILQVAGARSLQECISSTSDIEQWYLFESTTLRDSTEQPCEFESMLSLKIFCDTDEPKVTGIDIDLVDDESNFVEQFDGFTKLLAKMKWE